MNRISPPTRALLVFIMLAFPLATFAMNAHHLELLPDEHVYGNPQANLSLITYCGLDEPFCTRLYPSIIEIVDESKGGVNWVFRHFPLFFHEHAQFGAEASECVATLGGNDAFWKFLTLNYAGGGPAPENVDAFILTLGIDAHAFKTCLDAGKFRGRIDSHKVMGTEDEVTGTPDTFLVNRRSGAHVRISGAQPKSQFEQKIQLWASEPSENSLLSPGKMKERLCKRVRWLAANPTAFERVQERVQKRFGFRCSL